MQICIHKRIHHIHIRMSIIYAHKVANKSCIYTRIHHIHICRRIIYAHKVANKSRRRFSGNSRDRFLATF